MTEEMAWRACAYFQNWYAENAPVLDALAKERSDLPGTEELAAALADLPPLIGRVRRVLEDDRDARRERELRDSANAA